MVTEDGEVVNEVRAPFLRTPYNHDTDAFSRAFAIGNFGESLTDQSQKEEADINTIVRRFGLTGQLPSSVRVPQYGDFENALDFRQSMNAIRQAEESFMELPADVRAKFHNDPQELLEFCGELDSEGKPKNLVEMRKMGLAVPEEVVVPSVPMKVEVVNPPSAVPSTK